MNVVLRVHTSLKQDFVPVHIADPGGNRLVEQHVAHGGSYGGNGHAPEDRFHVWRASGEVRTQILDGIPYPGSAVDDDGRRPVTTGRTSTRLQHHPGRAISRAPVGGPMRQRPVIPRCTCNAHPRSNSTIRCFPTAWILSIVGTEKLGGPTAHRRSTSTHSAQCVSADCLAEPGGNPMDCVALRHQRPRKASPRLDGAKPLSRQQRVEWVGGNGLAVDGLECHAPPPPADVGKGGRCGCMKIRVVGE